MACLISCRPELAKTVASMHFQLVNFGDSVAKIAIMLAPFWGVWHYKSPNWREIAPIGRPAVNICSTVCEGVLMA